jgi:hypothetical protein
MSATETLLPMALSAAVPLWIERLRLLSAEQRIARARELAEFMHSPGIGESILFLIPGKSALGFNALAEAIACLSFCPGGITLFGNHFQAND